MRRIDERSNWNVTQLWFWAGIAKVRMSEARLLYFILENCNVLG